MSWMPPWLVEIGKTIWILLTALYNFLVWAGDGVASFAGEPARFLFYAIILILIPFFFLSRLISSAQASMESFHVSIAGWFLKAILIALIVFGFLFIANQL